MLAPPPGFSRRTLVAQGLVLTAAAFIAGCAAEGEGEGSAAAAGSAPPADLHDAAIDLRLNAAGQPFVSGTVGGRTSHMTGSYFGSSINGSLDGAALDAQLAEKDQTPQGSGFVTTTHLTGGMGGYATTLLGVFDLDAHYLFQRGLVTGTRHGHKVHVRATPNSGFGSVGAAADVKGTFGTTPFSLVANLPTGHRGTVTGTVGGRKIHLVRTQTGTSGGAPSTRLTGTYSGPADLLALLLGAVSYFGG
jgi:hypothetical protein